LNSLKTSLGWYLMISVFCILRGLWTEKSELAVRTALTHGDVFVAVTSDEFVQFHVLVPHLSLLLNRVRGLLGQVLQAKLAKDGGHSNSFFVENMVSVRVDPSVVNNVIVAAWLDKTAVEPSLLIMIFVVVIHHRCETVAVRNTRLFKRDELEQHLRPPLFVVFPFLLDEFLLLVLIHLEVIFCTHR